MLFTHPLNGLRLQPGVLWHSCTLAWPAALLLSVTLNCPLAPWTEECLQQDCMQRTVSSSLQATLPALMHRQNAFGKHCRHRVWGHPLAIHQVMSNFSLIAEQSGSMKRPSGHFAWQKPGYQHFSWQQNLQSSTSIGAGVALLVPFDSFSGHQRLDFSWFCVPQPCADAMAVVMCLLQICSTAAIPPCAHWVCWAVLSAEHFSFLSLSPVTVDSPCH